MLFTTPPIGSRAIRIEGKSSPSIWTQRYNKYLTHPVFLVLTASYETSFFLLFVLLMFLLSFRFLPILSKTKSEQKNLDRNLQNGPLWTRLERGMNYTKPY